MKNPITRSTPAVCSTSLIIAILVSIGWLAGHTTTDPQIAPSALTRSDNADQIQITENYGNLPMAFEVNEGQTDPQVKYFARGQGYDLWLTGGGATLQLRSGDPKFGNATGKSDLFQMRLANANRQAKVSGEAELAGKTNYFFGSDQSKWKRDVSLYSKVRYSSVYNGIDVVYYGNQQQLEYDFVVAPQADPRNIRLHFDGAKDISIDETGELVLHASGGDVRWHIPVSYQEENGVRSEVASRYTINDANEIGFELGAYDTNRPLTIDPALAYSTYFSANTDVKIKGMKADAAGNVYIFGSTSSRNNYPTTAGAYRQTVTCGTDADCQALFVTKLNPTGTALVYSTFIATGSANDGDLAIDSAGNAYITATHSEPQGFPNDFPTTAGSYQPTFGGRSDVSITKLNSAGNALVFSTYLGGTGDEFAGGIAVDSNNNVYVSGRTYTFQNQLTFPVTAGAWDTNFALGNNGFLTKLNAAGTLLMYSTLIPQPGSHSSVAVDTAGNAYVFFDSSFDVGHGYVFPTTPSAFQPNPASDLGIDCVIAKFNSAGSALLYGSHLGGLNNDYSGKIAVDNAGRAYLKGLTSSSNFRVTPNAFKTTSSVDPATSNANDEFFTVVDTTASGAASLVYSTFLGGTREESNDGADQGGIALDGSGNAWLSGTTLSNDFPTTPGAFQQSGLNNYRTSAYVGKFNPNLSGTASLVYSTIFHQTFGSNLTNASGLGIAYVGGNVLLAGAADPGLPSTGGVFQPNGGIGSGYVMKLSAAARGPFDFDGDGKTDLSIFRPGPGQWWYYRSSDGGNAAAAFGASTDKIVPGDYTGDGKADMAFFRPSTGEWFILRSENGSYYSFPFGASTDVPVPADYDGDGKTDAAVYRPSTNTWFIIRSSDNGTTITTFGAAGDVPVAADYDGDGKADIAIYRPSVGQWWIQRSTAGTIVYAFGNSTDRTVQGDYTGDGKADVAFWRPSTGEWFILRSDDGSYFSFPFGTNGDVPSPGDYDGDGKFDATVFRPSSSTWFANRSTAGVLIQGFGQTGDISVPNAFVR